MTVFFVLVISLDFRQQHIIFRLENSFECIPDFLLVIKKESFLKTPHLKMPAIITSKNC